MKYFLSVFAEFNARINFQRAHESLIVFCGYDRWHHQKSIAFCQSLHDLRSHLRGDTTKVQSFNNLFYGFPGNIARCLSSFIRIPQLEFILIFCRDLYHRKLFDCGILDLKFHHEHPVNPANQVSASLVCRPLFKSCIVGANNCS